MSHTLPNLWKAAQAKGVTVEQWTGHLMEIGVMGVSMGGVPVTDALLQGIADWIGVPEPESPKPTPAASPSPAEQAFSFEHESVARCVVCKVNPTHLYSTRLGGPTCNSCHQAKLAEWNAVQK